MNITQWLSLSALTLAAFLCIARAEAAVAGPAPLSFAQPSETSRQVLNMPAYYTYRGHRYNYRYHGRYYYYRYNGRYYNHRTYTNGRWRYY
jgi:hypothetical protein